MHNNDLDRLPDEIGHLQNLTTLGLIGNKLSYLPITISKLQNLKALWLTPNQTQPLVHLQNEKLPDGQIVLTSVVFPQTPLRNTSSTRISQQPAHISFSTSDRFDAEVTEAHISLSRTPTPHHKELKRLREVLRGTQTTGKEIQKQCEIKEAKVTHISADMNTSQGSLNGYDIDNSESLSDITGEINKTPPKEPPPYHIAAAYSKNAHLFAYSSGPPNPHDHPKQFSQRQPTNILMPTPKLPSNRVVTINVDDTQGQQLDQKSIQSTSTSTEDFSSAQAKWPFGKHKVCQVLEIELPEEYTGYEFSISVQNDVSIVYLLLISNSWYSNNLLHIYIFILFMPNISSILLTTNNYIFGYLP